tara:strand:- start:1706 stop:1885 length:180 start_codon:yes stop_codon:yes gene_type:complete
MKNSEFLQEAVNLFAQLDQEKSEAKFYLNGNEILIDKMSSPNNSHNIRYDFKIKPKIII